ncbi:MAG: LacI family DNA-binding transcriptional regulator [Bacteroidota bacterium]
MSVTIKQVAREAGVSISTVSRVLNGSGPAAPATRDAVQGVVDRLGYVPNATAQGLVRSRTDAVGVVLPFLTGEFYPELVRGLDLAAQATDRHLVLLTSHNRPADTDRALRALYGRVDGLVVMAPAVPLASVAAALPPELPVVFLNAPDEEHGFDMLSTDAYGGTQLAVQHLVDLGHRRIACLAGEAGNHDAELRLAAWRNVLTEHGLASPDAFVLRGDFSRESGVAAGQRLADLALAPDGPTAAFASSDYMAMGAILALAEAGLVVPQDLALTSFDDIPSAAYFNPPLTTVHPHTHDLGSLAAEWLFDRLAADTPPPPRQYVLPVRLEVRASSGPPR